MVVALGWCAAIVLAACAVDEPGLGETQQLERNSPEPPFDTLCGDGLCSGQETQANCPEDCPATPPPFCGDGLCNGNETQASCPADCTPPPVCGDGVCSAGENCPVDCAPVVCGDCICSAGETTSCPWDCNLPNYPTWCLEP
jgi:hypothetical protein